MENKTVNCSRWGCFLFLFYVEIKGGFLAVAHTAEVCEACGELLGT